MLKLLRMSPLLLGLVALGTACSAQYEVGAMNPNGTGGADAAGGAAGRSAGDTAGDRSAGGGNRGGAGATLSDMCIRRLAPAPLGGKLATPGEVWNRVSKLVWGDEPHAPPATLPRESSHVWVGQLVEQAFAQAATEVGGVPGASYFVRRWLDLEDAELEGGYDAQLASGETVLLEALLESSWAPGRVGVFSEPSFVSRFGSIPSRGAAISSALFGREVPAPPPNVNRNVFGNGLTDRQAVEMAVATQIPCAACHRLMDPLGYALGHFDREGNYRELDHGQEIITSGTFELSNGATITFDGIAQLGARAAETCDANQNVVDSLLRVALSERGYDSQTREALITTNTERVRSAYLVGGRSYLALVKGYAQSRLVLDP